MRIKKILPKLVILVLCALAMYFILNKLNDVTGDDQEKINAENNEFISDLENNAIIINEQYLFIADK
jgi:hypothetical protein